MTERSGIGAPQVVLRIMWTLYEPLMLRRDGEVGV